MSKYDKFIEELKHEASTMETPNVLPQIKNAIEKRQTINKKTMFKFSFIPLSVISAVLVVALILTIALKKNTNSDNLPPHFSNQVIADNIDDAYAFEMMTAGNFLFTRSNNTQSRLRKRSFSKNNDLSLVAGRLNEHYLTIKQLLKNKKVHYEIISSTSKYTNEMIIRPFLNNDAYLMYTIYYNKTTTLIKDDEELYNFEGIIIINNVEYVIEGETEIEEDEIETKIKVVLNDNEYFIIEQEKEKDEEEYVYKTYVNGILEKEYSLSYETKNGRAEIEIDIEERGKKEKIVAKAKNNEVFLEVEFNDYEGIIIATNNGTTIKYYFEKEEYEIEKKIFN